MRFLSVAEREMRAAARRPVTYYTRWLTGLGAFGLLLWLLWVMRGGTSTGAAKEIMQVFSALTFFYCLLLGTARTADCLSSEKREGTLGLLYLTNLNSAEIVVGKLCSHAMVTVYGLLAIFPILALPLLMGGVTLEEFSRTLLALVNAIFAALAAGLVASVLFTRQFPAVAFALGLIVFWAGGMLGMAEIISEYRGNPLVVKWCATMSPLYALVTADGKPWRGSNYWLSLLTVAGLAALGIVGVMWRLSRSWQDRPAVVRRPGRWKFWRRQASTIRTPAPGLRRRLLDINPFYWLAGRRLISAPIFMGLMVVLVMLTVYVSVPAAQHMFRREEYGAMIGSLFAWVWVVMGLHGLVLYYAAMIASQRLAEDKQNGALEMILCTPTTERAISRGLWQAFFRRMTFPAAMVVLFHALFIWQIMVMCTLEPPNHHKVQPGTAADYFWGVVLDQPVRGGMLPWDFVVMCRIAIFLLPAALLIWYTLGWVGRWLGLKMKHPGFAPLVALAVTFVPPILGFSLLCYCADEAGFFRRPDRQIMPIMMWLAFAWGAGYCGLLCLWSAWRLRTEFRNVVTSRFQPPSSRRWWRPNWRIIGRVALWLIALGTVIVLLIVGFFAYQNSATQRAWKKFQAELQQRGESVEFALPATASVPDAENLMEQPVFQRTLRESQNLGGLVLRLAHLQNPYQRWAMDQIVAWPAHNSFPLAEHARWVNAARSFKKDADRTVVARALLQDLEPYREELREFAQTAQLPYYQPKTNLAAELVIRGDTAEGTVLERVHFVFALRASALLEAGQSNAAADVQTGLRLARLARQTPDARASMRQQVLLVRTLQPLWEGLHKHKWTAAELTQFETELARFTLLADYTNDVRRVVQAHLQLWSQFPERPAHEQRMPTTSGTSHMVRAEWKHEPVNWWYNRCRQLYAAGQTALERVDVENGWVTLRYDSQVLDDLPLNDDVHGLLQPHLWGKAHPILLAFAQSALNQAILACALERYWLAKGEYPEKLITLVPEWRLHIPPDPVAKRPMNYERIVPGQYLLRCFGPDQEDDRKNKAMNDWLWAYPTNAPAVVPPK